MFPRCWQCTRCCYRYVRPSQICHCSEPIEQQLSMSEYTNYLSDQHLHRSSVLLGIRLTVESTSESAAMTARGTYLVVTQACRRATTVTSSRLPVGWSSGRALRHAAISPCQCRPRVSAGKRAPSSLN